MRVLIAGIVCAIMFVAAIAIPAMGSDMSTAPAPVPALPTVTVSIPGATVSLPPLPPVTVTLPAVTVRPPSLPGKETTVFLPRPTKTVFITQPQRTIYLPRPTQTVTITANPKTVVSSVPVPAPTATVTKTVVKHAGQATVHDGTLCPDRPTLIKRLTSPEVVGLGALGVGVLVGLILLAMYGGYILGYKDSERKDTNFIAALRDTMLTRHK